MRILYVCTANICRSPSAAALLRDAAVPGVEVRSAGTLASFGAPGCQYAPALRGRSDEHRSQPLTPDLLAWSDLVLTAAREHRSAAAEIARDRTFTIRQAGRLAQWLLDAGMVQAARDREAVFEEGDPRATVVPFPADPAQAPAWVVGELDAARGMAPTPVSQEHPDDIPDPHVLGVGWHEPAYEQIVAATAPLVVLLREVLAG